MTTTPTRRRPSSAPRQDRTNHTPKRYVRIDDETFNAVGARAADEGLDFSKVARKLLEEYAAGRITVGLTVKQKR